MTLCYSVLPRVPLCYPVFPYVSLCYPVYLLKSSCHPSHTKKSIPYTMALRQRWICSTDDFFNKRLNAVTTHLINTACKHRFIQQEMNKVRLIPRSHAFETFTRQESDRVPFLVTFNPALPNINHIICGNLNILHSSQRCKEELPSPPLISYRRCNNLHENLVWAKHRRPPPKTPGDFRCNRSRCKTCPFITEGTTPYTYFSTNEQRRIRHHSSCSSSNFIYMIQCNKCNMQYIGETKRQLSDRFAEHRRSIEKASNPRRFYHPTAVSDHFSLPDRSIKEIELIPLELINSNRRDGIRTAREGCLISKGKTLEPYGMNRRHQI